MTRVAGALLGVAIALCGVRGVGLAADQPQPPKPAPKPAAPEAKAGRPDPKATADDYYELQRLLVDTLDQVERNYVKDVTRRQLVEAAIKGVLEKLDPYSSYISPDELTAFRNSVESEFGGIGIQITIEGGQLKVLSPLVGTPAYRAGLLAGDRILEIDGKSTAGITLDQAVRRMKGEVGTKVTLTVLHPGRAKPEKLTIVRDHIHVETVLGDRRGPDDAWDYMLDPQQRIGYVRLTAFSRNTARELREVMERLQKAKLRGLILDLRFNPGGLLSSAIEVSDLFVANGRIVSTQGRNTPERVWHAHQEGTFTGFPMVVLINRFSASASEIVAACLQDHKRALIVGERTWGKGSVQNVIELEDGRSALKLTTASYRRPNGKNIHRFADAKESEEWGVAPDKGHERRLNDAELLRLVEDRRQRDVLQPKGATSAKAATPQTAPPDRLAPPADKDKPQPSPSEPERASSDPGAEGASGVLEQAKAVDPHLGMALDYLTSELARAK